MEYRVLGATGLLVSALGFGGNDLGRDRRGGITAETLRTIAAALDHGVTLFDTANSYVSGDSERMLGHALAGRRQDIVLCSKAGHGFWASLPAQRLVGPLNRRSSRNFRPSARRAGRAPAIRARRPTHFAGAARVGRLASVYSGAHGIDLRLRLEGLASVPVGMRRYEHLHESVDTVACLSVTRQS